MGADGGLVAGRSQREKRRSYKDLLREEEEIAAEVRKSSKKRPKVSVLSLYSCLFYGLCYMGITCIVSVQIRILSFSCWEGTCTRRRRNIAMITITGVRVMPAKVLLHIYTPGHN